MGMNWFEGGRRMVSLLAGLIVVGGAIYLFAGPGEQRIILETTGPEARFQWTLKDCRYPDAEKAWSGTVEFKSGDPRAVVACFRAEKDGKIIYAYGPERLIPVHTQLGQPRSKPYKVREIFSGDQYSDEVERYTNERASRFTLTGHEMEAIGDAQWKIGVVRFSERATEAFPWIAGLIVGLWVIAAGLGWLIRGFASIPSGSDYQAEERNVAARQNRVSLDWLGTAVGGSALVSGVAWLILKAITPGTSATGRVVGKALHIGGMILLLVIGFTTFLGGAMALRGLTYRLLRREEPYWGADDRSIWLFGIANGVLLALISAALNAYTVVGLWLNGLDHWSRANGYSDGGTVGLFILCLLWPIIPLYALNRWQKPLADAV
jgi:hypothetical protein